MPSGMIRRQLSLSVRGLRRNPVFALTTLVTIALGVAASTAIFSVVDAVLLRPLPYRDPDRLVLANGEMQKRNVTDTPLSSADFFDLRNGAQSTFEDLAGVRTGRTLLVDGDAPSEVRYAAVTPNFLRLLGGRIVLGRDFTDADGQPDPADAPDRPDPQILLRPTMMVILSHGYWQRRYGGRTDILGRGLVSQGQGGAQIVGVLAPRFELLFPPRLNVERAPDVWVAARLSYDNAGRRLFVHRVVGRLREGVSLETARRQVDGVSAGLRRQFQLWEAAGFRISLEPMGKYLVAQVAPAIVALMGAALFLFLIACANVFNLLMVRASSRERELATRMALGASRWQLIQQVLAEAVVLAVAGAVLGLGIAWVALQKLMALVPANLPRADGVGMTAGVLVFALLLSLATAILIGLLPALRASRRDVMNGLRATGRNAERRGAGLVRSTVVAAEVALSFVLLIGSGLMLRSFVALQAIDPGFDARGVLTFQLLGAEQPEPHQREALMRTVRDRLKAIPGVEAVTAARPFPLADTPSAIRWGTEAAQSDPSAFQAVDQQRVLPGYFETLRTPLLAGRTFEEADNNPQRNVVVIDQVLAAKAFPNESAVGKRLLTRIRTAEPEWVEVVGVVGHQRAATLAEPGREQIYFTDGYLGHGGAARWAVRTAGDPRDYADPIRQAIAGVDRRFMISEVEPMAGLVRRAGAATRFSLLLIGLFAAIAAVLATVGIYGVLSTVVRQRTTEIGIRMAVGATPQSILNLVVGHGLKLAVAGLLAGLAAAFGLTHLMKSMLVGVSATDPFTYAAVTVFFVAIAAAAFWLPARRAAAIDPTVALRQE